MKSRRIEFLSATVRLNDKYELSFLRRKGSLLFPSSKRESITWTFEMLFERVSNFFHKLDFLATKDALKEQKSPAFV